MGYQGKKSLWKRHNKYNDSSNYKVGVKMKKITNFIKDNVKVVVAFILGGIILGAYGTYASSIISASDVSYSNASSAISSTNVQGAIDSLYKKAKDAEAKCPDGYKCTKMICKRATTLHKEVCTNSDSSLYCQADGYTLNSEIEYGSLGTKGTLTSGDAFDCDVNGDGKYDPETERFYYVSDVTNGITTDSDTAVLIYYSNVSGGVPSNKTTYAYYSAANENWHGPVTAIKQLPTTTQWKITLINTKRQITTQIGTTSTSGGSLPIFSYEGYAARLLTVQEINAGCGFTVGWYKAGELSTKCKYLMENTKYSGSENRLLGWWLETPRSDTSNYLWRIQSNARSDDNYDANDASGIGIRPVIEVLKKKMSY